MSESSSSPGMARQRAIYRAGARHERPSQPIAIEALEARAREVLPAEAWGFLYGGAGIGDTMRANLEAFRRWRLVPRMLRDVASRQLEVEVLGQVMSSPVLLAPIGAQGLYDAEGEVATARGAAAAGLPLVLSTVSSRSLEDVATEMGDLPRWFQLYWCRDREFAVSLLQRAEAAGYGAVVLTLDVPFLAWREGDLENAFLPFMHGQGLGNFVSDPVFCAALDAPPEEDPQGAAKRFGQIFGNPSLTWDDLAWLRRQTSLPIVLKGILAPEDARLAIDHGAAGVVVSNHGGRQIDGAIGALDALPAIVEAVAGEAEVLFDSGVRRGSDVLKAVALGAGAVLVGRPYIYGLSIGGADGVREVLLNLMADMDLTLGLLGCRSFGELDAGCLRLIEPLAER